MTNLSVEQLVRLRRTEQEKIEAANRRIERINDALYDLTEKVELALPH